MAAAMFALAGVVSSTTDGVVTGAKSNACVAFSTYSPSGWSSRDVLGCSLSSFTCGTLQSSSGLWPLRNHGLESLGRSALRFLQTTCETRPWPSELLRVTGLAWSSVSFLLTFNSSPSIWEARSDSFGEEYPS